jgi:hypothetical protein
MMWVIVRNKKLYRHNYAVVLLTLYFNFTSKNRYNYVILIN